MVVDARNRVVSTFLELAALPSPAREEGPAAEFVRGYLDALGVLWTEDDAAERIPAGCGNITATLPATRAGTPIFLCSHLDTVALDDDVVPVVRDGGRIENEREAILGGDNKAAVAVMLELIREIVEEGREHAGLEVVFTPCEEVGLLGAKAYDTTGMIARFGYVFDHARDIGHIVGAAPTQYSFDVTFTGRASHSGIAPEKGASAIVAAADAISRLELGRIDERTTANVGIIDGGTAVNIVPERCRVRAEVRSIDHDRVVELAGSMKDVFAQAATRHGIDVDIAAREEYRAYSFSPTSPVVKLAMGALRAAGHEDPQLVPCGGGSDANVFNAMGKPCANLCNGMRDIHTSTEHIFVRDLDSMLEVSRALLDGAIDG